VERGDGWGEKILGRFSRERGEGAFLVLRLGGFHCGDFVTKAAGLFSAEGVFRSLGKGAVARVFNQHVSPGVKLDQRMRTANEMEAAEH